MMDPILPNSAAERRRAIFKRVAARYLSSGLTLDDPVYLRLIEAWIAGENEMKEAATQWNDWRLRRFTGRSDLTPAPDGLFRQSEPALEERAASQDDGVDLEDPEWVRAMRATKMER
jgi:hypothetical protein